MTVSENNVLYLMGGMPKSGTSCLAGAMNLCGLNMTLSETNQSLRLFSPSAGEEYLTDEKYYMYEAGGLMVLNEQLLHGVITGWEMMSSPRNPGIGGMLNPPHIDSLHADERVYAIIGALGQTSISGFPFGIKDPRMTFLYGIWRDAFSALGIQCKPMFSVREPMAAANALVERGWLSSIDVALEIWLRYNSTVLHWCLHADADIVIFDQSDNYLGQIEVLSKKIGLSYDQEKMNQFYKSSEPKLVDSKPLDRHLLRASIIDVYEQLLARRLN